MKQRFRDIRVVVIGGGTGTYSVLYGLKALTEKITAIVSMADSGGSARKERDEWGLLPSSDIRKSLLALADVSGYDNLLLRKLFEYRYSEGKGLKGMTFGNLFLVTLTKLLRSQSKAIEKAGEFLQIKGKVLPVSLEKVDLVAEYADGSKVTGEHLIDQPPHQKKGMIAKLYTKPLVSITCDVEKAIAEADVIIIGPGSFYTTVLANLIIKGMDKALKNSQAKKIFVMNLMTEYGQTYGFCASSFLRELNRFFPVKYLDYVFVNKTPIPKNIILKYKRYKTIPVVNDLNKKEPFKIIYADLISDKIVRKQKGDSLRRSFVRHDPVKFAFLCKKVLNLI